MSQSSPLSESPGPKEDSRDEKSLSKESLIIGITCGILGFVAIIIIFLVIGLKFRKKKKTRDESEDGDPSTNSNAQLLKGDDGETQSNILQKYGLPLPLDAKKSTSCPDIYSVNKSILLKIGSTTNAYEHLEQNSNAGSIAGSIKYKSEDRIGLRTTRRTSLGQSLKNLVMDDVDGKLFADDSHIYHLPSMSETFRRQSDAETKKHDSGIFLVSHGSKIPLFIEPGENGGEHVDQYVSGYQSPKSPHMASTDELSFPSHPYVNTNIPGYQTPTSGSPRIMPKNRNSGIVPTGFRTTNSNSPKLFPKPNNLTPNQIKKEMENDDDNIYEVPKFDDSIYTNIPARTSIISQGSYDRERNISVVESYKPPLPPPPAHRSYSIGSSKERPQRPPENQIYVAPTNYSASQPSLLKTNSEKLQTNRTKDKNNSPDRIPSGMIYDIPSRSHTFGESTLKRNTNNENQVRRNTDGVNRKNKDSDDNTNKFIAPCDDSPNDDTIYDVPMFRHSVHDPLPLLPSYKYIADPNHDTEREHYIDLDKLHRESMSHIDRHDNNDSNQNIRDTTYDVPNLGLDRSPSSEDDGNYYNITPATTLEKRRSAGLMKKMGYDVPSTTPVFDPSQPSLLKLASKHLYKNKDSTTANHHHQNKFPIGGRTPAIYDKPPPNIPEYDPSEAYTTRPINKKITNNQSNRSQHFTDDHSIYDIPTNNKLATSASVESSEVTSLDDEGYGNDSIYQNVGQLEKGQNYLRSSKSNGEVC